MANKEPKVKVQNLTKKFGDLLVLDNLNFEVEEGEFLCIVGPTGCGKTTFLNSLTRLYEPTSGEILVNGIPVDPKKQNISYIFQEYSSFPWLFVCHCPAPPLQRMIYYRIDLAAQPQKFGIGVITGTRYQEGRTPPEGTALH